jgi:pimeloyl-ACP methyl ester carboxylesterase
MAGTAATIPFQERRILAEDGLSLYVRDYEPQRSHRAAVLCLPGMTRNSKDFDHLAPTLALQRRIICPDFRGRGLSAYDDDWRNYQPVTYINDILHLLAALNIPKVVVIGTSLGGALAMGLAVARPNMLAGAVLNDIGPELGTDGIERILDYVARDRPQPTWEAAGAEMQRTFGYLELGEPENWQRMARATYREAPDGQLHFDWDVRLARAARKTMRERLDLWPYFRALRPIPTLVLRGGQSAVLSAEGLARMKAEKPDLIAVTVPGVGHTPNLGEPIAAVALARFLAALP